MIRGGKLVTSFPPNPNMIAASEAFGIDLTALMVKILIPAFIVHYSVKRLFSLESLPKGGAHEFDGVDEAETSGVSLSFFKDMLGPIVVIGPSCTSLNRWN